MPPHQLRTKCLCGCGPLASSLQPWRGGQAEEARPSPWNHPVLYHICKYCEAKPPPVSKTPWGRGHRLTPPAFLYLPLRHRYCKLAGLTCGQGRPRSLRPCGVKGLGPVHPKKKNQCGGEGREGLAQSHRWKGINSPKVPLPAPAWSGLHGLCPESPMSGHWAWALWEGADPRGKQRASQGTPTFSH